MGHYLSKPSSRVSVASSQNVSKSPRESRLQEDQEHQQEEEEEEILDTEVRRIIIKIQLAKMENGNEQVVEQASIDAEGAATSAAVAATVDTLNANEQIVNVTLGAAGGAATIAATMSGAGAAAAAAGAIRTAGSSTEAPKTNERQLVNSRNSNNNNNNNNSNGNLAGSVASASTAVKSLQLHDDSNNEVYFIGSGSDDGDDDSEIAESSLLRRRRSRSRSRSRSSSTEGVEYCEVLEPPSVNEMLSSEAQRTQASSYKECCRSRSSKALSLGAVGTTTTTSKRRCCKCKCRDALRGLRGMLESSSSSSSNNNNNKDKKETAMSRSKTSRSSAAGAAAGIADRRSTPPTTSSSSTLAATMARQRQRNSVAVAEPSQLAIWAAPANGHGDVIIRISSQPPQPNAGCSACSASNNNNNGGNVNSVAAPAVVTMGPNIRLVASTEPLPLAIEATTQRRPATTTAATAANSYGAGVTVHSQIDFMHCLVPDLEKIINSSFYWGKMDRYEAERLLEGKPEGTFLLRDSAQEEFLFSVTFRKYGRSLHARIEQSGHKFSFDCHDPCVFTALTVTGLLEHYKDPSCVMFFEPCLTMPLHRRQTFSLQQLSRATIVSNTTYDGINQLELPGRLKSYLKEYHYKQKLRVKPCDAHTPAPYYSNI